MTTRPTIGILDTTLRDGMQTPGIGCNLEKRIQIARAIASCNVDYMEIGMPANSIDYHMIPHIAQAIYDINPHIGISVLCRNVKSDVDKCAQLFEHCPQSAKLVHMFIATSDALLKHSLGKSKIDVLNKIEDIIPYCANIVNAPIEGTPEDAAATTDMGFLEDVISAMITHGATTINLPDTTGWADTTEYGDLFAHMTEKYPEYIFHCHPHNDDGCAVAKAVSAVKNGAAYVEGTALGIGERAGNVDWMVVASYIKQKGYVTNISYENIFPAATTIAKTMGIHISKNHPTLGQNCHRTSSGIHGKAVVSDTRSYHHFQPESIGAPPVELVLGQTSGAHVVKKKLEEWGYTVNGNLEAITLQIKELGLEHGEVTREHIDSIPF